MNLQKINDEVFVALDPIVRIGARELAFLKEQARAQKAEAFKQLAETLEDERKMMSMRRQQIEQRKEIDEQERAMQAQREAMEKKQQEEERRLEEERRVEEGKRLREEAKLQEERQCLDGSGGDGGEHATGEEQRYEAVHGDEPHR